MFGIALRWKCRKGQVAAVEREGVEVDVQVEGAAAAIPNAEIVLLEGMAHDLPRGVWDRIADRRSHRGDRRARRGWVIRSGGPATRSPRSRRTTSRCGSSGPRRLRSRSVWRQRRPARVDVVHHHRGDVFAEWVRPRYLHDLEVMLDGDPLAELDLDAGDGAIEVDLRARAPRRASARGWAWGLPVTADGRRRAADDRFWSVIAAAYVDDRITDAELLDVGTRAGAVTPATALLALEPGAKPGVAHPAPGPLPVPRISRCGVASFGGSFGRFSLDFDEAAFIRDAVAEAARGCHLGERSVTAEVTTTYAEIVDVRVEVDDDPAAATCVRDRLWAVEFPMGRHAVVRHDVVSPVAG